MKIPHRFIQRHLPLLSAALFAAAPLSRLHASLLVYEGFDGYTAGNIGGQAVSDSAVGLKNSYASSSTQVLYQADGLSFSDLAVSGGSVIHQGTTGTNFGAALDTGSVTGTVYASYLVKFSSSGDNASRAFSAIVPNSATDGTRAFAALADNYNSTSSAIGYDGVDANATNSGVALSGGVTYLVLARFTNVGSPLSLETPGVATLWVVTASQFDHFQAAGFDDAALDSAAIGSGDADVVARVSDSVTSGSYAFDNTKFLQLGLNSNSASRSFVLDEVRYGTSLGDVTPVPEPSAAASLAASIVAFALFAGKRRKRAGVSR